jgi:hypothetical protein
MEARSEGMAFVRLEGAGFASSLFEIAGIRDILSIDPEGFK